MQTDLSYKSLFNSVTDPLFIVDSRLKIVDINPAAIVFFKLQKTNLSETSIVKLLGLANKKLFLTSFKKFLHKGLQHGNLEIIDADNKSRFLTYDIAITNHKDRNLIIFRDLTPHKLEEKRKAHFLGIAGHELKAPLASAKVNLELLKQNPNLAGNYIQKIEDKLDILKELISDLLDVTRYENGKLEFVNEVFDFDDLVTQGVLERSQIIKTHRFIRKGSVKSMAFSDRKRISQVIINLLKNATKYSPGADKVIIKTWEKYGQIGVSVQDFGMGLTKSDAKHVFDIYFRGQDTRKNGIQGLGLGLFISAQIIKRSGGKIWVDSQKNKGSTFSFSIPAADLLPNRVTKTSYRSNQFLFKA